MNSMSIRRMEESEYRCLWSFTRIVRDHDVVTGSKHTTSSIIRTSNNGFGNTTLVFNRSSIRIGETEKSSYLGNIRWGCPFPNYLHLLGIHIDTIRRRLQILARVVLPRPVSNLAWSHNHVPFLRGFEPWKRDSGTHTPHPYGDIGTSNTQTCFMIWEKRKALLTLKGSL